MLTKIHFPWQVKRYHTTFSKSATCSICMLWIVVDFQAMCIENHVARQYLVSLVGQAIILYQNMLHDKVCKRKVTWNIQTIHSIIIYSAALSKGSERTPSAFSRGGQLWKASQSDSLGHVHFSHYSLARSTSIMFSHTFAWCHLHPSTVWDQTHLGPLVRSLYTLSWTLTCVPFSGPVVWTNQWSVKTRQN